MAGESYSLTGGIRRKLKSQAFIGSPISLNAQRLVLMCPALMALGIALDWHAFGATFVPRGAAELLARVGCVR